MGLVMPRLELIQELCQKEYRKLVSYLDDPKIVASVPGTKNIVKGLLESFTTYLFPSMLNATVDDIVDSETFRRDKPRKIEKLESFLRVIAPKIKSSSLTELVLRLKYPKLKEQIESITDKSSKFSGQWLRFCEFLGCYCQVLRDVGDYKKYTTSQLVNDNELKAYALMRIFGHPNRYKEFMSDIFGDLLEAKGDQLYLVSSGIDIIITLEDFLLQFMMDKDSSYLEIIASNGLADFNNLLKQLGSTINILGQIVEDNKSEIDQLRKEPLLILSAVIERWITDTLKNDLVLMELYADPSKRRMLKLKYTM